MSKNTKQAYSAFPWSYEKNEWPLPGRPPHSWIKNANGQTIADAIYTNDARLMAAAPELLEALKLIVSDVYSGTPIKMDDTRMLQALAAIARAEGTESDTE